MKCKIKFEINNLAPQYDCCDKYLTQNKWSSKGIVELVHNPGTLQLKCMYKIGIKLCLPWFDPRFNDLQISFWGYALEQQQLRIY